MKEHQYQTTLKWTGNQGKGTSSYRAYSRDHTISIVNKPDILGSSDPSFRGDKTRHNPEEMLVASLSACHMLWFLHLCSVVGIVVTDYTDDAIGVMEETPDGSGQFKEVTLQPKVIITNGDKIEEANGLHHQANKMCFIANSCNFPVKHVAECRRINS